MPEENGWQEWRRHVLIEMEALRKGQEKIDERMGQMATEIALLKLKSSMWGAAAAGVVILIYTAISFLTKR